MRKFYRSCPACVRRMSMIASIGKPGLRWIDYECSCGRRWTYEERTNTMRPGKFADYIEEPKQTQLPL